MSVFTCLCICPLLLLVHDSVFTVIAEEGLS